MSIFGKNKMFKFNFEVNQNIDSVLPSAKETLETNSKPEEDRPAEIDCHDAHKVIPDIVYDLSTVKPHCLELKNDEIKYVSSEFIMQKFGSKDKSVKEDIEVAEKFNTDLIPGVYEGGAKIWECTVDLIEYISENLRKTFHGKRVLDLGCGAGILGIYSFKLGARVHFQDYNKSVLEHITIPNVILNIFKETKNIETSILDENFEFYSGDWSKYNELTRSVDKFDIILTSETIYSPANYQKLLETFDCKLKNNGIVLLAAKSYYFGVGGGTRQFETFIKNDGRFKSKVLWNTSSGLIREIIEIKRA